MEVDRMQISPAPEVRSGSAEQRLVKASEQNKAKEVYPLEAQLDYGQKSQAVKTEIPRDFNSVQAAEKQPASLEKDEEKSGTTPPPARKMPDMVNKAISFSYNKEIDRIIITVSDRDSNKVLKEIPPEKTQKMFENLRLMSGLIVDSQI